MVVIVWGSDSRSFKQNKNIHSSLLSTNMDFQTHMLPPCIIAMTKKEVEKAMSEDAHDEKKKRKRGNLVHKDVSSIWQLLPTLDL